ncbi:unnamed protein product [Pleuronectes platessa]|uniref:Uncharacterized protein n=1 Tax=Pleuronectes platessa TaxID=8262 RepID=A0A9N7W0C9_PLEPL|nr:unnamed protein product [Pleuronectes platessa]
MKTAKWKRLLYQQGVHAQEIKRDPESGRKQVLELLRHEEIVTNELERVRTPGVNHSIDEERANKHRWNPNEWKKRKKRTRKEENGNDGWQSAKAAARKPPRPRARERDRPELVRGASNKTASAAPTRASQAVIRLNSTKREETAERREKDAQPRKADGRARHQGWEATRARGAVSLTRDPATNRADGNRLAPATGPSCHFRPSNGVELARRSPSTERDKTMPARTVYFRRLCLAVETWEDKRKRRRVDPRGSMRLRSSQTADLQDPREELCATQMPANK